jgi:hypothetical protein
MAIALVSGVLAAPATIRRCSRIVSLWSPTACTVTIRSSRGGDDHEKARRFDRGARDRSTLTLD